MIAICGSDRNDILTGGAGLDSRPDQVLGQAGDDDLKGNAGSDTLRGGEGVNNFDGGPGNDHCILENRKERNNTRSCEKKTLDFTLDFYPAKEPS